MNAGVGKKDKFLGLKITPLNKRRLLNFKNNRRGYWSFWIFSSLFILSLFAELIANDTPYGLTNYIQTKDKEKVKRVARKLRSGMVDVNGAGIAVDAPFGGFKHSGIGREAGEHGLEEFLEVKSVGGWS